MRQRLSELLAGARLLLRGFATWSRDPGMMLLGAVPALIVGMVMLGLLILLAFQAGGWATALTPFAGEWEQIWSDLLRTALALGIVAGAVVLCVLTFAAITLTVGEPFYERISRSVETRLGGVPQGAEPGFWRSAARGLRDGIVLLGMAVGTAAVVFLVGLVPLVGTALSLVTGAVLGGRALAIELTGIAGDARGMTRTERRALLAAQRWRSLGFGMVAYLLLLVPGLAVAVMPAAIVGGTLLVRDLRGEPTTAQAASS